MFMEDLIGCNLVLRIFPSESGKNVLARIVVVVTAVSLLMLLGRVSWRPIPMHASDIHLVPILVVLLAGLVASITDVRVLKVHNALTLPLIFSGLLYHAFAGGLSTSLIGMCFGFAVLLIPYLLGGMGGGDVKLLAGVGAWLGMPLIFFIFIVAGILSGLCSMAVIICNNSALAAYANLLNTWDRITHLSNQTAAKELADNPTQLSERGRVIPFGVMIALGTLIVVCALFYIG